MAHDDEQQPPPYPEERDADLEQKYHVPFDDSLDTILCVEGVPAVAKEKVEKLTALLVKIFEKVGRVRKDSIHLATAADGSTKGFVFVEYEDAAETQRVAKLLEGYQLDKNHTFSVSSFGDVFTYANAPAEWTAPVKEAYKERENLRSWLLDAGARDQFVTRVGDETIVSWNTKEEPEASYRRQNWTDTIVQWSPKGTYLVTFHKQGIALWGGASWAKIVRFSHERVREIDFSPNENFLVTWSEREHTQQQADNLTVWNVATGMKVVSFKAERLSWPVFKWACDDSFLARVGEDVISIYEMGDMRLKERKNLYVDLVRDVSFSPRQKLVAYWALEAGSDIARVTLLDLTTMTPVRKLAFYKVFDVKFHWQSEGDFLVVKAETFTKTKKSVTTALHVVRLRGKEASVEVVNFEDGAVNSVSLEPKGNMFVASRGEGPNTQILFYSVDETVRLVKTLDKKQMNQVVWSPRGQFVVLAGLGAPMNGLFEFWNAKDGELMATGEHFMCTDLEWDPTGRYLITAVSAWKERTETGFTLWDFKGKMLYKAAVAHFFQVHWRPRPATLLSKNKLADIKKNLSKYSAVFSKQDEAKTSSVTNAARERRRAMMNEWFEYMRRVGEEYLQQKSAREELRGYASDEEEGSETIEEIVEEIIDETKTLVK